MFGKLGYLLNLKSITVLKCTAKPHSSLEKELMSQNFTCTHSLLVSNAKTLSFTLTSLLLSFHCQCEHKLQRIRVIKYNLLLMLTSRVGETHCLSLTLERAALFSPLQTGQSQARNILQHPQHCKSLSFVSSEGWNL